MAIATQMRPYKYYTYGEEDNYGQPILSGLSTDTINIAIYTIEPTINPNALYSDCTYMGLTPQAITDKYVIQYGEEKLKVKYAVKHNRLTQVWLVKQQ